jgi:hypothetical protein
MAHRQQRRQAALLLSPYLPYGAAEVVAVAFQIVALTLDADDNVIERRVVPRPYETRQGRSQQSSVL